jgi:hypothetical protein
MVIISRCFYNCYYKLLKYNTRQKRKELLGQLIGCGTDFGGAHENENEYEGRVFYRKISFV